MAYKVLIIGCGAIAGGYDAERSPEDWPLSHAGAMARSDDFELVACVDPNEAVREAFAQRWEVQVAEASLEELGSESGAYDLIVIASPTQHHSDHLTWAIKAAASAVFCEKPLVQDPDDAERLVEYLASENTLLAVNYTRRWAPDMVEYAARISADWWGELISATGTYSKGIVHNGSHMIDLLHLLIGEMTLHAVGPARLDYWESDPSASAILAAENGAPIHLIAGDARAVTQFELVLSFEKGEIAIRDGGMRIETRKAGNSPHASGYRQLGSPESVPGRYPEAMSRAYANIAEALDGSARLASTAENALAAQRLCEEIRRKALDNIRKETPE